MSISNPDVATELESDLQQTYARRFEGQELRRKQVWEVLCSSFFSRWVRPQDTVLDLGAGYCEFINSIQAGKKLALDLNPATATHAAPGVAVISQDICKPWDIAPSSVDVVFTSNFFEHLENKEGLVHCLKEIRRVLKPKGHFIALGPNIKYAYKVYWDYFDHYLPLSDRSMVEGLELNGFQLEEVIPRFLPFTMRGSMPSHPALVRLYLAIPLAWRIMGEQFLIVART
jgi:SAM-dependent methyltransferase